MATWLRLLAPRPVMRLSVASRPHRPGSKHRPRRTHEIHPWADLGATGSECINNGMESERVMGARIKQLKGWIKQAAGSLVGNQKLVREGRIERLSGRARQRFDEARDKVGDVIDRSADAATHAVRPGRNGRRPT
jgi:uncharacterized protein YjbJ (UPF0337 family)